MYNKQKNSKENLLRYNFNDNQNHKEYSDGIDFLLGYNEGKFLINHNLDAYIQYKMLLLKDVLKYLENKSMYE